MLTHWSWPRVQTKCEVLPMIMRSQGSPWHIGQGPAAFHPAHPARAPYLPNLRCVKIFALILPAPMHRTELRKIDWSRAKGLRSILRTQPPYTILFQMPQCYREAGANTCSPAWKLRGVSLFQLMGKQPYYDVLRLIVFEHTKSYKVCEFHATRVALNKWYNCSLLNCTKWDISKGPNIFFLVIYSVMPLRGPRKVTLFVFCRIHETSWNNHRRCGDNCWLGT